MSQKQPHIPPLPSKVGLMPTFKPLTEQANQPSFNDYCANFPDAAAVCTPRTGPLAPYEPLTQERWAALHKVARDTNGQGDPKYKIIYPDPKPHYDPKTKTTTKLVGDPAIYGPQVHDRFVNPLSPHYKGPRQGKFPLGDCDDFALAQQSILIKEHGFRPENLLFAYVANKGDGNLNHAVLLALTDHGVFMLDTGTTEVKRLEESSYHFMMVQDRTNPRTFVEIQVEGTTEQRSAGANTYSHKLSNSYYIRSAYSHSRIAQPGEVRVSSGGWQCQAQAPFDYTHHRLNSTSYHRFTGLDRIFQNVEIVQEYDGEGKVSSTLYRSFGRGIAITNEVGFTPQQSKKLAATRKRNPQIQGIIDALRTSGIDCHTVQSPFEPVPLPLPTILQKIPESALSTPPVTR